MFTLRLLKIKIHSRRVSIFKRSLPIFAFLLAGVMIVWPALNEQNDKFAKMLPSKETVKGGQTDMEQVRFFSKDTKQNPITVVAKTVRETDSSRQIVFMEQPDVTYKMADGTVLTGVTPFGLAFQQEKYLYFEEQVDAQTDTGYFAVSDKVICEYSAGTIGSESDVFIKGPAGMLKANGFFVKEKGSYIHFKGYTDTLLFQKEKTIPEVENLTFKQQKKYWDENKQNIYITSENGLIINQKDQTITALKNVSVIQENNVLEAPKIVLNYLQMPDTGMQMKKITAFDGVEATQQKQKVSGETMILYKDSAEIADVLKDLMGIKDAQTAQTPIQIIVVDKNAVVTDGLNKVFADKIYMLYTQEGESADKIVAVGNMIAHNGAQRIKGMSGVYTTATQIISVSKNVSLQEKESVLTGDYATLNLKTGISSLTAPKTVNGKKGRVKGSIIPNDFKKNKSEVK